MTDKIKIDSEFIDNFVDEVTGTLKSLPKKEIAKAVSVLFDVYRQNGRIYVFGNGGSFSMATHWVSDFNKTVFNSCLSGNRPRFRAIRIPTTEEELTAWANDVGYDMVFAGPLANYLENGDLIIAISSSGNSPNVIEAVKLAKKRGNYVIGISGFDGGELNKLADAKILVETKRGEYEIVESVHSVILHLMTKFFREYFSKLPQ